MSPYFSVCANEFRPWYWASHVPVARKLVPPGMENGVTTCWFSSSTQPNAYSGGTSSSYMPSIMASLVGCSCDTSTAEECAVTIRAHEATMPTTAPTRMVLMAKSACLPRSRYHAPTAREANAPRISSATTTWV